MIQGGVNGLYKKLTEPPELIQAKREGISDYSEITTSVKDAVKAQLYCEQKGICAYCMRRIYLESI